MIRFHRNDARAIFVSIVLVLASSYSTVSADNAAPIEDLTVVSIEAVKMPDPPDREHNWDKYPLVKVSFSTVGDLSRLRPAYGRKAHVSISECKKHETRDFGGPLLFDQAGDVVPQNEDSKNVMAAGADKQLYHFYFGIVPNGPRSIDLSKTDMDVIVPHPFGKIWSNDYLRDEKKPLCFTVISYTAKTNQVTIPMDDLSAAVKASIAP
jgi:hypothetical protein